MKATRFIWWPAETDPSKDDALVCALELSTRACNQLCAWDIVTVRRLRRIPDRELLRIPNFGKKSLREVRELVPFRLEPGESEIKSRFGSGWFGIDDKPRIRVYAA